MELCHAYLFSSAWSNSPSQDYTHPDDRTLLYDIFFLFSFLTILLLKCVLF